LGEGLIRLSGKESAMTLFLSRVICATPFALAAIWLYTI
jgi:hypothetical protein